MINIRTIKKLKNNEGLTLRRGRVMRYKTGWQVATDGIETKDPKVAINQVKAYEGNCGLWFADGVYYVDKSHRVNTKHEALKVGRAHNQISIYGWTSGILVFC